jgi:hypothetical protein
MNEFNAFAKQAPVGFNAFVRTIKDGGAKPLLSKGGKPTVFLTELDALRAALEHLLRYINGNFVRDGAIAEAVAAADEVFKPSVRQKRKRRAKFFQKRKGPDGRAAH